MSASIKRYNRCKWMAIVSLVFTAMTLGFIIPGAMGVSGGNNYNDTLLYLALIDSLFAILFFVGWLVCQFEVEDIKAKFDTHKRKTNNALSYGSIRSTFSSHSSASHQPLTLGASHTMSIEKNA